MINYLTSLRRTTELDLARDFATSSDAPEKKNYNFDKLGRFEEKRKTVQLFGNTGEATLCDH